MSDSSFSLLAQATLGEKMIDAITVTVVGMGIVMLSLWVMGEIFKLLGKLMIGKSDAPAEPAPVAKPSATSVPASGVDPKLIAILTAAAVAATGRRVAVRRVTFINHNTVSGWAEAGRLSIQTSHNIRRNG